MKKTFKLENLDCAACAAKMESGISKIKGVSNVSINFMFQKMILEAEDAEFEQVLEQARSYCKKIEPDCVIK